MDANASGPGGWLSSVFEGRPWWMNIMLVFCAFMTFIYMPFDLFWKPVAEDQEVWFGFLVTGWAAKATAPLHWAIYALGFVGFRGMKPWMHPWAALYVMQIAIGMLVWSVLDERSPGWWSGVPVFAVFTGMAWLLWSNASLFRETQSAHSEPPTARRA
jgi:hypothetical protein